MNRIVLISILLISSVANAQQYRKFLFAIDLGVLGAKSLPLNSITMEPAYRINDKVLIGFRIEQTGMVSMMGGKNESLGSMGLNAHYYFKLSSMRAFGGLGIGLYNPDNNFIMSNTNKLNQRNGLGLYPRIGLEFGHFRVMAEYNFIQTMKDYIFPDAMVVMGSTGHYENFNKSYFSLKIGFFLGGGKKKLK